MSKLHGTAERPAILSLSLAGAAFLLFAASCWFNDAIFKANLETAVVQLDTDNVIQSGSTRVAAEDSVVGTEEFWLGHAKNTDHVKVSWSQDIDKGDRIAIVTGGQQRMLEVETVDPVRLSQVTHIDSGRVRSLFMVTAREVGERDGMVMRFVIEAQDIQPAPTWRVKAKDGAELSAL